ncbi:hypothetical protein POM88_003862 [Heracleum sosnowskyi]|uniref:Protein kinase domain-containing protein n=1 Tax=Heracleum sosnowskyi TaxID=360622 RepID=A0AAD8JH09_9APIA|nr:hypothetical protein POM88_003862 [Heracleum sosnowskyi]
MVVEDPEVGAPNQIMNVGSRWSDKVVEDPEVGAPDQIMNIAGPSWPLSLKGSPYWMAPEIIKNSNACNLAVDIWSLGCTVLEMATTKPPWSEFEGVAAMFKIGNRKELSCNPRTSLR